MTIAKYDLHTHTSCSDGALTPTSLVASAAEAGISCLAITDHDTVAGIDEALAASQAHSMRLVAGVEISSRWCDMDIHVVGLAVDHQSDELLQRLKTQNQRRYERAEKVCQRLETATLKGLYQQLLVKTAGKPPGRPDIAALLIETGRCRTQQEAFRKYLGMGKSAYVKTDWPDINDSIRWIQDAKGLAVLAHPSRYKLTRTKLKRLIAAFAEAGGDAIEVSISAQDATKTAQIAGFAQEYGLLASSGSDFHSPAMSWIRLGDVPALPQACKPIWQAEAFNSLG